MQLGLWLEIRPSDELPRLADRVAGMGFSSLHAHFPAGCDEALAHRLRRACERAGLAIAAASGYANPLRPETAPMGSSMAQLAELVALLPALNTSRVVAWSGSFGPGLLDDHPDNHTNVGWDALRRGVDAIFPALEDAEALLLFEPYYTHVLSGPEQVVRFCDELNSPYLGAVLDPPNMLPAAKWPRQAQLIREAVSKLANHIGLVHFKDMRLKGGELDLPGPGQGVLDYGAFMGALRDLGTAVPLIVEHVTLEQAPAARRFVLSKSV